MFPMIDYPKKGWDERLGWLLICFFALGMIALIIAAKAIEQQATIDIYPVIQQR